MHFPRYHHRCASVTKHRHFSTGKASRGLKHCKKPMVLQHQIGTIGLLTTSSELSDYFIKKTINLVCVVRRQDNLSKRRHDWLLIPGVYQISIGGPLCLLKHIITTWTEDRLYNHYTFQHASAATSANTRRLPNAVGPSSAIPTHIIPDLFLSFIGISIE